MSQKKIVVFTTQVLHSSSSGLGMMRLYFIQRCDQKIIDLYVQNFEEIESQVEEGVGAATLAHQQIVQWNPGVVVKASDKLPNQRK